MWHEGDNDHRLLAKDSVKIRKSYTQKGKIKLIWKFVQTEIYPNRLFCFDEAVEVSLSPSLHVFRGTNHITKALQLLKNLEQVKNLFWIRTILTIRRSKTLKKL